MKKNASIKLFFLLSIILIQTSNQNFLQFDIKTKCPKVPLTPLGILISLSESDDSAYESTLSPSEREPYESIIELKRSFSSTMSYIPQSFSPENEEYWKGLNYLLIVFVIIAIFPTLFIIFYLLMRFVFKKCTGPKKISQVNKLYRNLTWLIMILSTIVTAILFAIVLGKSVAVGKNISIAFDFAVDSISKSDTAYSNINNAVEVFRNYNKSNILPDTNFMAKFKDNIENYIKNTKERTQQILDDDSARTKITAFVFTGYYFLILLAFLFFFLKSEKLECLISVFLFFAVPSILVLEGYNAKFFFYYGDLCDSVNGALYKNEYPVAGQSLGYYYNCFPIETKASLYNIRYRLYQIYYDTTKIDNYDELDAKEKEKYNKIKQTYSEIEENTFNQLFNCEMVSKVIPKIEAQFCKDSLDHMYTLILLMTWIVLTSLGVAIGARRLQVLIWKKRNEIESMMQNEEVMF